MALDRESRCGPDTDMLAEPLVTESQRPKRNGGNIFAGKPSESKINEICSTYSPMAPTIIDPFETQADRAVVNGPVRN